MVKHSRGDADKAKKAQEGGLAVVFLGIIVSSVKGYIDSRKNAQEAQEIQEQIAEIDQEIEGYRSKFLGEIMHADEIEELEAKREELRKRI